MRATEPALSPPISGAANAATAIANTAAAFPGTLRQFAPLPERNAPAMTAVMRRTSASGLAITPEPIS